MSEAPLRCTSQSDVARWLERFLPARAVAAHLADHAVPAEHAALASPDGTAMYAAASHLLWVEQVVGLLCVGRVRAQQPCWQVWCSLSHIPRGTGCKTALPASLHTRYALGQRMVNTG